MAKIQVEKERTPTTIDRFLGLNESTSGDTQLQLGESPNMSNFRLTEDYKLRKREGYEQLFDSLGNFDIQGIWYGKLSGVFHLLFAANGNVYKHANGVNTSIGTLNNARTHFFAFDEKVYMLNGSQYKSWDGTTFQDVAGYIPLIATATPPSGGGVDNEGINLLTGKKRQTFSADGTATAFNVRERSLTSVDVVKVDGVTKTAGTDYTIDLTNGRVTFTTTPITGVDNVEIQWTKGSGSRTEVTKHKFAMFFGGKNDSRIFIYGNGSNRYLFTGLASGVPSAEYFPALNYREVGSNQFQVTDIMRQYDRQLIYTNGGEAYYSYYDSFNDANENVIADFPTFPLSNAIGNVAPGQSRLIQNNPYTIQNGVHEWVATSVRDERNAQYISKRVQPSLDLQTLSQAITIDFDSRKEYWLAVGSNVWVYNYKLDAWYKFILSDVPTCFYVIENELHFGTKNGQIMKFDRTLYTDNGVTIQSIWEMGFYSFGSEWIRKFMNEMWISLKPEVKSQVHLTYQTDRDAKSDTYTATYSMSTFTEANFGDWSFLVNYNPQPFRFKVKAKKFVYFKLIFENNNDDDKLTILSINLPVRFGSKVK